MNPKDISVDINTEKAGVTPYYADPKPNTRQRAVQGARKSIAHTNDEIILFPSDDDATNASDTKRVTRYHEEVSYFCSIMIMMM